MKFKYKGKIYNPKNPEKKLKQLKITWDEVEIINDLQEEKIVEYEDPKRLYYFLNRKTGYSISSINPECKFRGYESISLEELEEYRRELKKEK